MRMLMVIQLVVCVLLCVICSQVSFAQEQRSDSSEREAPTRRRRYRPLISPEVHPDRTVTFRLKAPNAQKVALVGGFADALGGASAELTKGENDIWSAKFGPIEPGIYNYLFDVDGALFPDPVNDKLKLWSNGVSSVVEILGDKPSFYDNKDVPHGMVHINWYESKVLGAKRRMHVYTPPGYGSGKKYPVLYLLHGMGDLDEGWLNNGRANFIMDNLLVEGRIEPMIVVMPYGHARFADESLQKADSRGRGAFGADLLQVVIPYIEKHYDALKERENRAIAGLSMGGDQALGIGLNNLDHFAWIGAFSSAIFSEPKESFAEIFKDPEKTNRQLKLLWIACGEEDELLSGSEKLIEALKESNIKHTYLVTEGAHTWKLWRVYLYEMTPLLFK